MNMEIPHENFKSIKLSNQGKPFFLFENFENYVPQISVSESIFQSILCEPVFEEKYRVLIWDSL